MRIKAGYKLSYECAVPTPIVFMIDIHPSRQADLITEQNISFDPGVHARSYLDGFGNICTRINAPEGRTTVSTAFEIGDDGLPDQIFPEARQLEVTELPDDTLIYLMGSRYCDTDKLSDFAWQRFAGTPAGWQRVQAICDFVHSHVRFDYQNANATRSASGALEDQTGVCRDYAHLAITLCRCMNIPARYCTGYLGDIGIPPVDYPMDFSAWFEVFLEGRWHTFDARHNTPRIGRILMARGRDATDVAISTAFGSALLVHFEVITDEVR